MKKIISFVGMLTIAAILMAGFTACSADDATENIEQPTEPYKIHVTVGAGLGDDETRSEVVLGTNSETGKTTRTLTFTEGDRLYIHGEAELLDREDIFTNIFCIAGYLDLYSGAGTTRATFSGDLTVWKKIDGSYINTSAYFGNDLDHFASEGSLNSTLIHKDAKSDAFPIDDKECRFDYTYSLVTGESDNVKKLMETAIHVSGPYDMDKSSFKLACGDPIFNCNFTVEGLSPNTEYYVRIVKDGNLATYNQKVTTDDRCYVHFACTTNLSGEGNWQVQLCTDADFNSSIFVRPIGTKNLGAKVYNVGNAPTPDPGDDPNPATDVISLSAVTSAFIGYVIGTDGQVYPPDYTMPDGVGKAAMICYVPSTGNGLAIELNSNPTECSFDNRTMPSGIYGGSWRTPSRNDWSNMVTNCGGSVGGSVSGSVSEFRDKYNATGVEFKTVYTGDRWGYGVQQELDVYYWTSESYNKSEADSYGSEGQYAYYVDISSGNLDFGSEYLGNHSGGTFHLACFEFQNSNP